MPTQKYYLGIDVGSVSTDIVLIDANKTLIYSAVALTAADGGRTAETLYEKMLADLKIAPENIVKAIACGYGRESIPFADKTITEITCHATAAHVLFPKAKTVIDIGGEDTKVIGLDREGRVKDFMMNNKCAAGTGRFLEAIAARLGVSLNDFIAAGETSTRDLDLNSTCTVFAESEVVSLIAAGATLADIARAVHKAIAGRIIDFSERLRDGGAVVLTGGVAKNRLLTVIMSGCLSCELLIPAEPQLIGALGAALLAERLDV